MCQNTGTRKVYYGICHPQLPIDPKYARITSVFFPPFSFLLFLQLLFQSPHCMGTLKKVTNLCGREATMGILLLCEPLHNECCQSQVLRGWGWLGSEESEEDIGIHLYFSRGSLWLVQIALQFSGFLRSFPMDGVVLG